MSEEPSEIDRLRSEVAKLSERVARLEGDMAVTATRSPSTGFGLTAINRIGAVTVAIGIIFFFKYAVDEHLIGATAGVWLGIVFGSLLIGAGDRLNRRGERAFAQGIAGCGLATLYITLYASFAYYQLIIQSAGFAALAVVCALAVGLSIRFESSVIAALGISGALLTPWLLHTAASEAWLEWVYLLVVNVTAIAISMRRGWATLIWIAGPLTLLAALGVFVKSPWHFVSLACAVGCCDFLAPRASIRSHLYLVGQIACIVAGMRAISVVITNPSVAYQMGSVLLACWGISALAVGLLRGSRLDTRFGLALLGVVIAKLYFWDVWQLEKVYRITAFLGLGGLLLLASWVYSRKTVSNRL